MRRDIGTGLGPDGREVTYRSTADLFKAREAVGQPIVDSIKGGDLSASVETAQKAFQAVLDAEKK